MTQHDHITDAQLAEADAAIVGNMTTRILGSEWGREIIDATIDECYSQWVIKISTLRNDAEHITRAHIVTIDPDTGKPGGNHVLHDDDIANAIARLWHGSIQCGYPRDYIIDAIADHDAGCIDADAADCILQAAAFGELVYG